jgi:hypothetical protein
MREEDEELACTLASAGGWPKEKYM